MHITEAQYEMRRAFLGGFMGQLVSGILWLISAGLATWSTPGRGIWFLVIAGMFIFPLTQFGLKLMGRPGKVAPDNGLYALGSQVAFVLPLSLPAAGAATMYRLDWFYPAMMVLVGAHYLPFVFLYGMRMFAVLAAALWAGGLALALWLDLPMAAGGWISAGLLLAFAVAGRTLALREEAETGWTASA